MRRLPEVVQLGAGAPLGQTSPRRWPVLAVLAGLAVNTPPGMTASEGDEAIGVSALGRIEPWHGVVRIAAPSTPDALSGAVVAELHVDIGDDVESGQLLAVMDTAPILEARLAEAEAGVVLSRQEAEAARAVAEEICVRAGVAAREAARLTRLRSQGLASEEETEGAVGDAEARSAACNAAGETAEVAEAKIGVAEAVLARVEASRKRADVRAPVGGRVLDVLAREGELAAADGILDLARIDRMYAIAEVYETDIPRVRPGQPARITSPVLPGILEGTVERIRPRVHKQDETDTDPAARKDARIIEVEVRVAEPDVIADLTYLQVEVLIGP